MMKNRMSALVVSAAQTVAGALASARKVPPMTEHGSAYRPRIANPYTAELRAKVYGDTADSTEQDERGGLAGMWEKFQSRFSSGASRAVRLVPPELLDVSTPSRFSLNPAALMTVEHDGSAESFTREDPALARLHELLESLHNSFENSQETEDLIGMLGALKLMYGVRYRPGTHLDALTARAQKLRDDIHSLQSIKASLGRRSLI